MSRRLRPQVERCDLVFSVPSGVKSLRFLGRAALATVILCSMAVAAGPSPSSFARWTFHEDFTHGIPGWLGYPLFQDVGYDPTVYTKKVNGRDVLVRDLISYGERMLRAGLRAAVKVSCGPGFLVSVRLWV